MSRKPRTAEAPVVEHLTHPEATCPTRPDAGLQAQFRVAASTQTYRYDSSLSPALEWDGQNSAREQGEALIREILEADDLTKAKAAAAKLKALGQPFLNWAGKAERLSFDVPTLPLFVHERLSTKAIIESLSAHMKAGQQRSMFDLYGDPKHSIADQHLKAYQHRDPWTNRLILGDNLTVMNSLLHNEKLAGQVQMIYMDPPYGVKFGSNFQPFVRKRDVSHGDDDEMTREPEMVQAYRDTWQVGVHSYLSYLRDRLRVSRELLALSGSVFLQISDENLHHAREVMDEVFGADNFIVVVAYRRLGMMVGETLQSSAHYLVWYARDKEQMKFRKMFDRQIPGVGSGDHYTQIQNMKSGETRSTTAEEKANASLIPDGWKPFQLVSLATGGYRPNTTINYEFEGKVYHPGPNKCWRTTKEGLTRLAALGRIAKAGKTLRYKQFLDDFPLMEVTTIWDDTARDPQNFYVVQTPSNVIRRCLLMTTDPGDLVLDPTCGSGTTAYVAEQWGRRWITIDVSRVPLALTRQRLLCATFPWYDLKDEARGPAGGFVYKRKQNNRGEEIGGIVPHITLGSIANDEPPDEEVLVDRPEVVKGIVRVVGPFTVEATIAPAAGADGRPVEHATEAEPRSFHERMLAVLRKSPRLAIGGNSFIEFDNARPPAKAQAIHAEARLVNGIIGPVAVVFGPEHGAVSEKLVFTAAKEANGKNYIHLVVIGFAIEAKARQLIDVCEQVCGITATYAQATLDLTMGDLLKNMKSSQILSVCGSPEIDVKRIPGTDGQPDRFTVELLGVDVLTRFKCG